MGNMKIFEDFSKWAYMPTCSLQFSHYLCHLYAHVLSRYSSTILSSPLITSPNRIKLKKWTYNFPKFCSLIIGIQVHIATSHILKHLMLRWAPYLGVISLPITTTKACGCYLVIVLNETLIVIINFGGGRMPSYIFKGDWTTSPNFVTYYAFNSQLYSFKEAPHM